MLSQTKMTEPSSATNAEWSGNSSVSDLIASEVESAANKCGPEIIFLLMDKWDRDMQKLLQQSLLTIDDLLRHYVRLKISLHHVTRRYERDWYVDDHKHEAMYRRHMNELRDKTKEARRDYYVAKQRIEREEGKHGSECACRGCKCIVSFGR